MFAMIVKLLSTPSFPVQPPNLYFLPYRKYQPKMKLEQAKNLVQGSWIYHDTFKNADGTPQRYKVLSVKTWRTRPNEVLVSVKWGLKGFFKINEDQLDAYTTTQN